jgi:membrane-bound serine protease (ClpP class)
MAGAMGWLALLLLLTAAEPAAGGPGSAPPASGDGEVHVADLRGIVHPLSARYLVEVIDRADEAGASLLVIELDTPGGLVDSTKEVVQRMLAARTPIAIHVAPSGARAASAGFLLLLGADVAAMAPGTNTGAAHPVGAGGSAERDDVGLAKAESDLAAFARTIAHNRRRNVELAERAVTESASFTEQEAFDQGLIDLIARDRAELLQRLDGRRVRRFDGSETVLSTRGAIATALERSWVQRWLGPLLRPELVVLLLGLGITGLYVEISHPGLILPGVVGVLCLLLFALAFQYLPINAVGLILIGLGVVLFVLEIKVTSYGLLTVGGVACLVLGLLMLFPRDVPALRVSPSFVIPLARAMGVVMGTFVLHAARAQHTPIATGAEGLIGEVGRAATELAPEGKVYVHGELWAARSDAPVARGEEVRVLGVDGLRLTVAKKEVATWK